MGVPAPVVKLNYTSPTLNQPLKSRYIACFNTLTDANIALIIKTGLARERESDSLGVPGSGVILLLIQRRFGGTTKGNNFPFNAALSGISFPS